jgi:Tfp pilus assembly protein PilF
MIRAWVRIVWFAAAGLIVYATFLSAPFVYDDASILEDRDIRRWAAPWDVIGASPDSAAAGRPVVHYSLALNYTLNRLDVSGYRVLNLVVHLACTLVLFGVVRRSLDRAGGPGDLGSASEGLAAAVAMIWMLHPLQSECVNFVSRRSESIMGLFYLLTLYASIRALDSNRRLLWWAAAIASCALGMASNETMVTAPLMVPLYDAIFAGRSPRQLLRERGALYGGLAACWIILVGLATFGSRAATAAVSLGPGTLDYAKNQCVVVLDYLRLVFWPHPLVLDYGYPRPMSAAEVAPYAVALAALLAATAVGLARWPKLALAAAWTFIILAPTSSFVPILTEVGAESRMYLPLAGPVVLVVVGAYLSIRRLGLGRYERWVALVLALAVAMPLAWATVQRNQDYSSALSVWRTVVDARPENPRGHAKLAVALQKSGRPDDAMIHYRRALELRPDYPEVLNDMGHLLLARGQLDEAMQQLHRAVEARPEYAEAHYNLAKAYERQGQKDEAVDHYREALRWDPQHVKAHNNLGTLLGGRGEMDEAIWHFREALRIEPGFSVARDNLKLALERARMLEGR